MSIDREYSKMLISDFYIKRKTKTADGAGGFVVTWAIVGSATIPIKGRLSTMGSGVGTGSDMLRANQFVDKETFILFLENGVNILREDMVEGESKTLRVVAVREPSHMNHHLQVMVEDMTPSGGV